MRDASVGITEEEVQPAGEEVAKSGVEVSAGSPKGEDTTKSDVEDQAGSPKGEAQSSEMKGPRMSTRRKNKSATCTEESIEDIESFVDDIAKTIGIRNSEKGHLKNKEKNIAKGEESKKKRGRPATASQVASGSHEIPSKRSPEQKRRKIPTRAIEKTKHGVNAEKCAFCKEEYLSESNSEGENPEQKWVPICKECNVSLKDRLVMKGVREIIARGRAKADDVDYICGVCDETIKSKIHVSIRCIQFSNWIHKTFTNFSSSKDAKKHEHVFKCKKCIEGDESPSHNMNNKVEPNKNNDSLDEANDSGLCEEPVSQPNNFNNISKVDLKSLEDGQWVTDNILTLALNIIREKSMVTM